jgi:hypothetical protein
MSDKTRVVRLRTGKFREDAVNAVTQVFDPERSLAGVSFEELFRRNYDAIRSICEGFEQPGLALIAVDSTGVTASACMAAKPDRINVAVVGRHGMADLYLEGDATLSLRHLAVILHPRPASDDIRFRILDLRTALAFVDENGRRLEALEAEGPVFIRCGAYPVFFLPTGDEIPWPDEPGAGWECIPERIYFDEELAEPDRWERRRLRARWQGADERPRRPRRAGRPAGTTRVQTFRGPVLAHRRLVAEEEEPMGELRIHSDAGTTGIAIGARAAREGVLFGRYDRCDNEGVPVLTHISISRVHVLVLEIAGQLYAIDTASTNGVFADGEEVRLVPLEYDQRLVLGDNLASVRWCVLN